MNIFSLFTLCGGLAFFLYGMTVMSKKSGKNGRRQAGAAAQAHDFQPHQKSAAGRRHHHRHSVLLRYDGHAGGSGELRCHGDRTDHRHHHGFQYRHHPDSVAAVPHRHRKRELLCQLPQAQEFLPPAGSHRYSAHYGLQAAAPPGRGPGDDGLLYFNVRHGADERCGVSSGRYAGLYPLHDCLHQSLPGCAGGPPSPASSSPPPPPLAFCRHWP